ncbi:energy transducer TonB, partial [Myxococcus xanthus]|nr:energy transducer TonB [Myxococcus xanthus]
MSQAVLENSPTTPTHDRSLAVVGAFLLVSLGIHVGGFWALGEGDSRSRPVPKRPVEMVMVEVAKPPPPPPEPPKPEEPPKPPPPKPKVVKPPPVKVAEA